MTPLTESDPRRLGAYQLVGRIGSGGFGVVYEALAADGSTVAIKLLRPEFSDDAKKLGRYLKRHPWRLLTKPRDR